MKKFIIRAFVKNNGELVSYLDTDNEIIIRDLKTFRGVLNRVKRMDWDKKVELVGIYEELNSKEELSTYYTPKNK